MIGYTIKLVLVGVKLHKASSFGWLLWFLSNRPYHGCDVGGCITNLSGLNSMMQEKWRMNRVQKTGISKIEWNRWK